MTVLTRHEAIQRAILNPELRDTIKELFGLSDSDFKSDSHNGDTRTCDFCGQHYAIQGGEYDTLDGCHIFNGREKGFHLENVTPIQKLIVDCLQILDHPRLCPACVDSLEGIGADIVSCGCGG
jgi:hypothetical protein